MKKTFIYLMLFVLGTLTLYGCGKADNEELSVQTQNSIIQFNSELVTDNTMYVIEEYIYPTSIADYVLIEGQMDVKITSIECPDGTVWKSNELSTLNMFETYDAATEPYRVNFSETFTGDTNTLLVYCYTKEQAVEKGMIENVIPFTFKDFIVDNTMNVVAGKRYSDAFDDYIITETIDTIEITEILNCNDNISLNYLLKGSYGYSTKMYIPLVPDMFKLTITDTSCDYSQDLYINVYAEDADLSGVTLAPSLE